MARETVVYSRKKRGYGGTNTRKKNSHVFVSAMRRTHNNRQAESRPSDAGGGGPDFVFLFFGCFFRVFDLQYPTIEVYGSLWWKS